LRQAWSANRRSFRSEARLLPFREGALKRTLGLGRAGLLARWLIEADGTLDVIAMH
jgi:hypothetical protein